MITFKKWLKIENLAGPGGGPEPTPENQELLAKNNNDHGVGAFKSYGTDDPPQHTTTPTANYHDTRFGKKFMCLDNELPKKLKGRNNMASRVSCHKRR